jgi:DNA-binding response OmpR family regulator
MQEDPEHVSVALKPHLLVVDNVFCGAYWSARRTALAGNFQLIIMDVMLPDCKEFDVLRDMRKQLTPLVLI